MVTNTAQRPRSTDVLATAIKWREIDETNVIFGRLAQVLAMLPVLETESLLQE